MRFFLSMTLRDVLLEILIALEKREYRKALAACEASGSQSQAYAAFRRVDARYGRLVQSRSVEQIIRLEARNGILLRAEDIEQ